MSGASPPSIFRRNVTWQFVGSASQAALSGIALLVLGRQLEAEGFGQYSIIVGFVYVANLLMEPRMQDVASKQLWSLGHESQKDEENGREFMDFLVFEAVVKLLPCVALVLLSGVLTAMAGLPSGSQALLIVAAIGTYFAKLGYGLSAGVLRILGRSDQFTLCNSGELALRLALMLAIVQFSDLTVANSIFALCAGGIAANFLQLGMAIRYIPALRAAVREWGPAASMRRLSHHRRLLLSNVGLSATDLMGKDLDVTILSSLVPAAEIGVYKMAKNIALLAWRAVDPFFLALMPELSRRVQTKDYAGTRLLLRRSSIGLAILAVTLSAIVYLTLVLWGGAILGDAFASIPQTISWMLVGVIVCAPLVWGHPLAVALNRADLAFTGSVISLVVGLSAFAIFVSMLGIRGAAISWSLSFLPFFTFTAFAAYAAFGRISSVRGSPSPEKR